MATIFLIYMLDANIFSGREMKVGLRVTQHRAVFSVIVFSDMRAASMFRVEVTMRVINS